MPTSEVRAGANATIIMNSASVVDGSVEWVLREELDRRHFKAHREAEALDSPQRRAAKEEANRQYEDFRSKRLRDAHGLDRIKTIFQEITGESLVKILQPEWEGISALFELRKLVAHGRMARGDVFPSDEHPRRGAAPTASSIEASFIVWTDTDPSWEVRLSKPLQVAEAYLRKKGVLTAGFLDNRDHSLADTYFTDSIADHFWGVARSSVAALSARFDCIADQGLRMRFDLE